MAVTSKKVIVLICCLCLLVVYLRKPYNEYRVLTWDKAGYYIYLPAVFIYHDVQGMGFSPTIARQYHPQGDAEWYYLYPYEGGKRLNKYFVGTSLFELPFFVVAHIICRISCAWPADGYSAIYQLAVSLATIFWVIAGLFVLRRFLLHYFNDGVVTFTLLAIGLGTNLFYYTAYDQGMSHPFMFFLCSCVLLLMQRILFQYHPRYLLLMGVVAGLILMVRPTNLLMLILPLLWQVNNWRSLLQRIKFLISKWKILLPAALLCFGIFSVQMAYWHTITGHWLHFSYEGEGFNFLRPHIYEGLLSYRKGWFIYTPMAFISILGTYSLWRQDRRLVPAVVLFLCFDIYIVFSWRMWYYGGGFGARPLIDIYPVVAFLLAAFIWSMATNMSKAFRYLASTLIVLLIGLNQMQSYQYSQSVIHWDRMNRAYYWRVFAKFRTTEEDRKLMMTDTEFEEAEKAMQR